MWGSFYIESSGTRFAIDFIGDMQDSILGGQLNNIGSSLGQNDVTNSTLRLVEQDIN